MKAIADLFSFYGAFGRPLTFMELATHLPADIDRVELLSFLEGAVASKKLIEKDGFYWRKEFALSADARKIQDLFLDEKWRALQKLSRWFRHVPFFEFVLVSGSVSFGNVDDDSDFDVLTGVRAGRMFTARYIANGLFSLLRARRLDDLEERNPNKLCFNHFVTRKTYEKEPHNFYRRELYRNMVPLWCEEDAFRAFVAANAWSGLNERSLLDLHRARNGKSGFARAIEWILGGAFGDLLETRIARPIAMRRLSAYLKEKANDAEKKRDGAGERVVVSDDELEFHFVLNYEAQFADLW